MRQKILKSRPFGSRPFQLVVRGIIAQVRTVGVCLDISNANADTHAPRHFHVLRPQNIREKRYTSPNLGPEAFLQMIVWV
jgi:hypothetical protein